MSVVRSDRPWASPRPLDRAHGGRVRERRTVVHFRMQPGRARHSVRRPISRRTRRPCAASQVSSCAISAALPEPGRSTCTRHERFFEAGSPGWNYGRVSSRPARELDRLPLGVGKRRQLLLHQEPNVGSASGWLWHMSSQLLADRACRMRGTRRQWPAEGPAEWRRNRVLERLRLDTWCGAARGRESRCTTAGPSALA